MARCKFSNVSEESTIFFFTHSTDRGSIHLSYFSEFVQGRVIGHRISRQPLTVVAQFQSQTSPRGICSGVRDTESDFLPSTAVLPVGVITDINAPYSFICLSWKTCFLKRRTASPDHHKLVCLMTGLQEFIDRQRLMTSLLIYSVPSSLLRAGITQSV